MTTAPPDALGEPLATSAVPCAAAVEIDHARPGEALLAFGPDAPPGFAEVLWLSRSGDPTEAAANLFASLRQLDRAEFTGIAVMPIPERGLGQAINDRLRRAAAAKAPRYSERPIVIRSS